jgi:hypothetical protein
MKLLSELDIESLIKNDQDMMSILRIARDFNLPDWWIGAGFLRNKIWDVLNDLATPTVTDVDLVYFDKNNVDPRLDWQYDEDLNKIEPSVKWEVRNQARMHYMNKMKPFLSVEDAMAHWPETATAIGVKLEGENIKLLFYYGADDLLDMIVRPTPYFQGDKISTFYYRIHKKKWLDRWPKLSIKDK